MDNMTYNQLYEFVYDGDYNKKEEIHGVDRVAWDILWFLNDLSGFDDWWDGIDDDIQDGIFDQLRTMLNNKKYIVFAGANYESGGAEEVVGVYDTLEDAKEMNSGTIGCDWLEIAEIEGNSLTVCTERGRNAGWYEV